MLNALRLLNSRDKLVLAVFFSLALLCALYFASGILVTYISSPAGALEMSKDGTGFTVRVYGFSTYSAAEQLSNALLEQRKVKATIHWVSASHAAKAIVRLYHPLLLTDQTKPPADQDWTQSLNPQSLEVLTGCLVEPSLRSASPGARFQFERQGYFCMDPDSTADTLIFNRTVSLKDAWAKIEKTQQASQR